MVVVIIMGVCGSGKTTVAGALALKLSCPLEDADNHHSAENVKKMSQAIPLTDEDRLPWLSSLHNILLKWVKTDSDGILACSALKKSYRDVLVGKDSPHDVSEHCHIVALHGSYELLSLRMRSRTQHYMPESLLKSQLDIIELPKSQEENCQIFDINNSVQYIVEQILAKVCN